jgi:hypothetical protein
MAYLDFAFPLAGSAPIAFANHKQTNRPNTLMKINTFPISGATDPKLAAFDDMRPRMAA